MNLRPLRLLGVLGAFLVPSLVTVAAAAQQVVYVAVPADGPRFRGGVALEGGPFIAPTPTGTLSIGGIGVYGQLGVQINNLWGVYGVPRFDVVFGHGLGGVAVGAGALADFTFPDLPLGVAAGPEVGAIGAFGESVSSNGGSAAAIGGAFYGVQLRAAYYPIIARGVGARRKALTIGLDLHLLFGDYAAAAASATVGGGGSATGGVGHFALQPMLSIGYTAF